MSFIFEVLAEGFRHLVDFGPNLRSILWLTLAVSLSATIIGSSIGVPAGVWLAQARFRGRLAVVTFVNVGMGLPPVLAGLFVLLLLWGEGPLGGLDLLFTPTAMVIVQSMLALPIALGITLGAVSGLSPAATEQLRALRLPFSGRLRILISEVRVGVLVAVAAAFGRVIAEVGAVLIVGGNISGETRVLTTAIVQETRQARFGAAIALGIVLLVLSTIVNGGLAWLQARGDGDG
ncbi:MAG: ABC transporter permease [Actinomycetota bacterium]|nr:ABC transporter permease [Actinomycetota bacterium]MDK1016207.1 ABC transporter permease [Actinomycetota bacterium]MDK1026316.1 ABC transporter permease [Actinomycetota bacterium]MDK1037763.1 ABC transporter permease [Actinomycetota bacterium]MDK1096273.1 ABC transporter permease [Actinomycetota bacterium]